MSRSGAFRHLSKMSRSSSWPNAARLPLPRLRRGPPPRPGVPGGRHGRAEDRGHRRHRHDRRAGARPRRLHPESGRPARASRSAAPRPEHSRSTPGVTTWSWPAWPATAGSSATRPAGRSTVEAEGTVPVLFDGRVQRDRRRHPGDRHHHRQRDRPRRLSPWCSTRKPPGPSAAKTPWSSPRSSPATIRCSCSSSPTSAPSTGGDATRTVTVAAGIVVDVRFEVVCQAGVEQWTPMESGSEADLADVWGTSATDVFTVGELDTDDENGFQIASVILHYDGTAWSLQRRIRDVSLRASGPPRPTTPGRSASISSTTTRGCCTTTAPSGPRQEGFESGRGRSLGLFAVWGSSASDVFAVGSELRRAVLTRSSSISTATAGSG